MRIQVSPLGTVAKRSSCVTRIKINTLYTYTQYVSVGRRTLGSPHSLFHAVQTWAFNF